MKAKLLFVIFFLSSMNLIAQESKAGKILLKRFREYISGDFDNSSQVFEQIKAGKIIHPFAVHVNRVADNKVFNRPSNLNGFFLLEESYYLYDGKLMESKPYLFLFSLHLGNIIHLTTYQLTNYKKEELRNDNTSLRFDYQSLIPSPSFQGADYTWDPKKKTFSTVSVNELGNGMKFTLSEIFTSTTLQVMELLEKNGKRLTSYDTPIVYVRKKRHPKASGMHDMQANINKSNELLLLLN